MLKGLQNIYDASKAYELSKKIQAVWLHVINTSAHWDLELLFARGKAWKVLRVQQLTVKVTDEYQQI